MPENYFGTDIAILNNSIYAPFGDADLVEGKKCLLQDLVLRLTTPKGDLWCHPDYGVDIYRFLHLEGTKVNQLDLQQTIREAALDDPRIKDTNVEISSWNGYTVQIKVTIQAVDGSNPINLVLGCDLSIMTMEVVTGGN